MATLAPGVCPVTFNVKLRFCILLFGPLHFLSLQIISKMVSKSKLLTFLQVIFVLQQLFEMLYHTVLIAPSVYFMTTKM